MSKPIDAFDKPIANTSTLREGTSGAAARADHDHGPTSISTLTQGGATTNQVLTWNGTAWVPANSSGGGGGGTGFDRRWNVASFETTIDEFNDNSLAAGWTRVDSSGGSGRAVWTEGADVLSVLNTGGDSSGELHAMMHSVSSLSAGDAFVTCVTLGSYHANFTMGGLVLADGATYGAGTQIVAFTYLSASADQNFDIRSFVNYSSNTATTGATFVPSGFPLWLRVVMTSANNWRVDWSPDDVSWFTGGTMSLTLTPSYVGLITSSWGTSIKSVTSYEAVRRVAGVT